MAATDSCESLLSGGIHNDFNFIEPLNLDSRSVNRQAFVMMSHFLHAHKTLMRTSLSRFLTCKLQKRETQSECLFCFLDF